MRLSAFLATSEVNFVDFDEERDDEERDDGFLLDSFSRANSLELCCSTRSSNAITTCVHITPTYHRAK